MYRFALDESLRERRRRVDLLTAAGIEPPARWTELNTALDAYLGLEDTAADRLAAAVITPPKGGADLAMLRALAVAEQAGPQAFARVNSIVVKAVSEAMMAAYEASAATNYATVAARFDALAAEFIAAAKLCDVDADAAEMVRAPDAARTAWVDAERITAELDQVLAVLVAAAELAGIRLDAADDAINQSRWTAPPAEGAVLALAVDPGSLHRRRVWEAWLCDTGRTRRWGALVTLGATIRAAALDGFTPYREPEPLIHRTEQVAGAPRGVVHQVTHDPEDPGYRPPAPAAGQQMTVVDNYR